MGTNSSVVLACFSIISLESLMGIFTNVFIISIISLNYFKYQDAISGSDKIIAALSISNVCYACISFTNILLFYFWPLIFVTSRLALAIFVAITFIFTTSLWLTASLCFFYFVKIQNFTSEFLSRLKTKISFLVPWMIFMSVVLSCFSSSLTIIQFAVDKKLSENIPDVHPANRSRTYTSSAGVFSDNLYMPFIFSIIPFVISVVTTASTAFSLHRHRVKMVKNSTPSSSNTRVGTYEDTIRIMILLLIFYAFTYVVLFLFYFNIFAPYSAEFWVFLITMCSYSPTQSVLLSLATTKLKKAWMKMFHISATSREEKQSREE